MLQITPDKCFRSADLNGGNENPGPIQQEMLLITDQHAGVETRSGINSSFRAGVRSIELPRDRTKREDDRHRERESKILTVLLPVPRKKSLTCIEQDQLTPENLTPFRLKLPKAWMLLNW